MLLEAAVVFILLSTDVTGVSEATCRVRDERGTGIVYLCLIHEEAGSAAGFEEQYFLDEWMTNFCHRNRVIRTTNK